MANKKIHVLLYIDPQFGYVGLDVFATIKAAHRQFQQRLKETRDAHPDDPDWIEYLDERPEIGELLFQDKSEYEVVYRCEIVQ